MTKICFAFLGLMIFLIAGLSCWGSEPILPSPQSLFGDPQPLHQYAPWERVFAGLTSFLGLVMAAISILWVSKKKMDELDDSGSASNILLVAMAVMAVSAIFCIVSLLFSDIVFLIAGFLLTLSTNLALMSSERDWRRLRRQVQPRH